MLNNYDAVMPLPIRSRFTINYIFTPFFVQQLGVFGKGDLSGDNFIQAIPKQIKLIEYNFNSRNPISANIAEGLKVDSWLTHHLDLTDRYEVLQKGYDRTLRNNLKKAEEDNLSIQQNADIKAVITLFREDKGAEIGKWNNADYERLERLITEGIRRDSAYVCMALKEGRPVSGAVFVWSNNHYIFLFSGNTSEGRTCGALPFLLDKFIESHAEQRATFDFEGSNNEGLARFYKSFGAAEVKYPHLRWNRLPKVLRLFKG